MPAFFAAAAATSIDDGIVMRNFASPFWSAKVISSTLYAGLAPETFPPGIALYQHVAVEDWWTIDKPARSVPSIATGYHIVLGENNATVCCSFNPYLLASAVDR